MTPQEGDRIKEKSLIRVGALIMEPDGEPEKPHLPAHDCTCAQDRIPECVCKKIDEPAETVPLLHWRTRLKDGLSLRD